MSISSSQRKQELLLELAHSRLQVIDDAGFIGGHIRYVFHKPAEMLSYVNQHKPLFLGMAALLGVLLTRMFIPSKPKHSKGAGVAAAVSTSWLLSTVLRPMLMASLSSLMPVIKQQIHHYVARKLQQRH